MNAKDVKTHVTNLERAVREKLPPSSVVDILSSLKNEVIATEQLLRVRLYQTPNFRPALPCHLLSPS